MVRGDRQVSANWLPFASRPVRRLLIIHPDIFRNHGASGTCFVYDLCIEWCRLLLQKPYHRNWRAQHCGHLQREKSPTFIFSRDIIHDNKKYPTLWFFCRPRKCVRLLPTRMLLKTLFTAPRCVPFSHIIYAHQYLHERKPFLTTK